MRSRRILRSGLAALPLAGVILTIASPVAGDSSSHAILFICGAEHHASDTAGPRRLSIESGMGVGGFAVGAKTPEAQAWFNYGIILFHAFYHDDAKLAFDKAVAADPACAMCLWGQALSRGPTQNYDIEPDQVKTAADLARKAQAAARTPAEKLLAAAMVDRYAAKPDAKAERGFSAALLRAADLEPSAVDLRLLAAESLLTAWRRGDKSAADPAVAIIEPILRREPNNTAAIHYYIHATEMAGRPALALPYAERLAALAPKASHLVHMASHTYLHVGFYEDAATTNAKALGVDADHARATGQSGPLGTPDYYPHNLMFGLEGALMAGDGALAVKFADDAPIAFPEKGGRTTGPYAIARTYVAYGRFDPDRALALPEPAKSDQYRQLMWRYARGEAFALKGDSKSVREESRRMVAGLGPTPNLTGLPTAQLQIGREVLDGRAAMIEGRPAAAAKLFEAAAAFQEKSGWGFDPPPWWYPVRRSLAAALLKSGDADRAAKEARASLAAWPGDGLALWVLSQAEAGLGEAAAARDHLAEAKRAWRGDLGRMTLDLV
jgi:tetratricopeptide (TPR) repeat protein